MNRTPRSTSRRASRQLLANECLPGSVPYSLWIDAGSSSMRHRPVGIPRLPLGRETSVRSDRMPDAWAERLVIQSR